MCVHLALGMPMAVYLGAARAGKTRLLALAYLPVAVSGIALSGSRTGLVTGVVAVAAVAVWLVGRSRLGLALIGALIAGGVAFAQVVVPAETWSRTVTLEFDAGGLGGRAELWMEGLEHFAEHPLVGVGASGYDVVVIPELHVGLVAHSTPLSIAVELGLVGLLLFYGGVALALRDALRSAADHRALAWALIATWMTGSLALMWEIRKPTWLVMLIAMVVAAMPTRAESRR